MAYRVFEVRNKDKERFEAALEDDQLGRQSITVRDARRLDMERDTFFVLVEGEDSAMPRAEALILEFGRRAARADEVRNAIREEEDTAASGLGFILGADDATNADRHA